MTADPRVAPVARGAVPLAEVVRGDLVESVHPGHLVLLDGDGAPALVLGDADAVVWPRSSVKPFQAVAMLRHGLVLPPRLLALAARCPFTKNPRPPNIRFSVTLSPTPGWSARTARIRCANSSSYATACSMARPSVRRSATGGWLRWPAAPTPARRLLR